MASPDPTPEQAHAIRALRRAAKVVESRPALIRDARAAGLKWDLIAEEINLSRISVIRMAKSDPEIE